MRKYLIFGILFLTFIIPNISLASFDVSLRAGSKGAAVTELQNFLRDYGFFDLTVKINGYFGPTTLKSVKAFQLANGLTPDGNFGPMSRAKANAILANIADLAEKTQQSNNPTPTTPTPVPVYTGNVVGCTSYTTYSPTSGKLCAGDESYLPGCTATSVYSPTTGLRCDGTSSPVTTVPTTPTTPTTPTATPTNPTNPTTPTTGSMGMLYIAGSENAFQVTLANYQKGSTTLQATANGGLKYVGTMYSECSSVAICSDSMYFTLNGVTNNVPLLPDDGTLYDFTVTVYGQTYTKSLLKDQLVTIF